MRHHLLSALRAFAASLCSAALGTLFLALMLTLHDEPHTVSIPFARVALMLALLACVNEALASRGVTLLLYGAVNTAIGAAGLYAVLRSTVFTPASGGYTVFLCALLACSVIHCAAGAVHPPDSNQFIWLADMLIIGLLLLLACAQLLDHALNTSATGFAAIALLTAFGMTSHLRSGGESGRVVRGTGVGGYLVLFAMLAVCLALAAGLFVLGGGQVDGIVSLVSALWKLLGAFFERIITVLASILSLNLGNYNVLKPEPGHFTVTIIPLDDPQAAGTAPMWLVYGFLVLLGLTLLAVVIGLLLDFRGKVAARVEVKRQRRVVTRKSHLLAALRALLRRMKDAVSFELSLRRNRYTPQGVYVLALRTCRAKEQKKLPSESPGAYLRRLHTLAEQETSTLHLLADQLDAALYGGESIRLSAEEYKRYAAQLREIARGKKQG